MTRVRGNDLLFSEIRQLTPQWDVNYRDWLVARVTLRVIAKPPYSVVLIAADGSETETAVQNRDVAFRMIRLHTQAMVTAGRQ